MITTSANESHSPFGERPVAVRRDARQAFQVDAILQAIVAFRQALESEEVAESRDRKLEVTLVRDALGGLGYLVLDAGRREQEIDEDPGLQTMAQPRRGEPACSAMLDDGIDRVTTPAQRVYDLLRLVVAVDGHDEVDIARKPRLTSRADGEPTNKRETRSQSLEVCRGAGGRVDYAARRRRFLGHGTRRPGASGARSSSHCSKSALSSAAVEVGWRLRRFSLISIIPSRCIAAASRSWAAISRTAALLPSRCLCARRLIPAIMRSSKRTCESCAAMSVWTR
jgi:hypothetical protein